MGKLKWQFQAEDVIHASPVVYNDRIYIGSFDGYMYCLNEADGTLIWKFKTVGATYFPKGEIQKAALVKDEVVYFGSRAYNIYVIDAKTGRGKWNFKQPRGWIIATPVEYNDKIYFGTSDAHLFYCMDKTNGEDIWKMPLNMKVYGSAAIYNDIVFFGTIDGKIIGADHLSGEIIWNFQTEAS